MKKIAISLTIVGFILSLWFNFVLMYSNQQLKDLLTESNNTLEQSQNDYIELEGVNDEFQFRLNMCEEQKGAE
jgi:hypothetical protein